MPKFLCDSQRKRYEPSNFIRFFKFQKISNLALFDVETILLKLYNGIHHIHFLKLQIRSIFVSIHFNIGAQKILRNEEALFIIDAYQKREYIISAEEASFTGKLDVTAAVRYTQKCIYIRVHTRVNTTIFNGGGAMPRQRNILWDHRANPSCFEPRLSFHPLDTT